MTDLEIIHEIEKYFGFKLKEVKYQQLKKENIIHVKRDEGTRNYSINKNGEVDGICLDLCQKQLPVQLLESLHGVKFLSLRNSFITNRLSLESFPGLESIDLCNNKLSDLSFLSKINRLVSLDLSKNNIKNISVLGQFVNLTWLNLSDNNINNIDALQQLTAITFLDLSHNQLKDISSLKELKGLSSLKLRNIKGPGMVIGNLGDLNKIEDKKSLDFSILKELRNLKTLDLSINDDIKDLSFLKDLTELNIFKADQNDFSGFTCLENLRKLTAVSLKKNRISDISFISKLTALTSVNLSYNSIVDLSPLQELTALEELDVSNNKIEGFGQFVFVRYLKGLKINVEKNPFVERYNLKFNESRQYDKIVDSLSGFKAAHIAEVEKNIRDILTLLPNKNSSEEIFKNSFSYSVNEYDEVIKMNLKGSYLKDLTLLQKFKKLTHLDLRSNQIKDIDPLSAMRQLEYLDLGINDIKNISGLKELASLTDLKLYSNFIEDVSPLQNFHLFRILDLSDNNIVDISPLSKIEIGEELNLQQNLIFDLSPLYNSIKTGAVFHFSIGKNPLRYPPAEVVDGKDSRAIVEWFDNKLETANGLIQKSIFYGNSILDLGDCGLTDLSMLPSLFDHTELTELILSNHYAEYNHETGEWHRIDNENKIYPNNICNIPKEIKKLQKLTKLIAGGDWRQSDSWNRFRIKDITNLVGLSNLVSLNVSNNEIEEIADLKELKKLKSLHANNNFIKKIGALEEFNSLEELFVSNNELTTVDFLKDLANIKSIDLHGNKISDLSPVMALIEKIGIADDKWKPNTICVNDNPLVNPPMEFVQRGKEAVLNLLIENAKGPTFENKDIKLIFVGNSESGKSTLVEYLTKGSVSRKKLPFTLLMEETSTRIDDKNVRILDFGGHDYYHDTHQIFFGNNVVYLLLWETATNRLASRTATQLDRENKPVQNEFQDYPLRYWLDSIVFFVKKKEATNLAFEVPEKKSTDSYKSFVLLVQNKARTFGEVGFLNNGEYKNKYPFIFDFVHIDTYEKRNIRHLKAVISEMLSTISIIGEKYPDYFKTIKDSFSKYNGELVFSLGSFRVYCSLILEMEVTEQQSKGILYYLDAIGVVLYHEENQTVFLNTSELSKKLISVFSGLEARKGMFDTAYVEEKVGKNSNELLALMKAYKLIFESPFQDEGKNVKYIAPLYLPREPDKLVKMFSNSKINIPVRRFIYCGFIHKNVILNIFSEYGKHVLVDEFKNNSYYWKNGLIIRDPESEQIVMITFNLGNDEGNAFIDIILPTHDDAESIFVKKMIAYIKEINNDYEIEEMVTLDGEDFVSLELLKENAASKVYTFSERRKKQRIEENGLKPRKPIVLSEYRKFIKGLLNMKKVFISYSHHDSDSMKELKKFLKGLERNGEIEPWTDLELESGVKVKDEIISRLEEADIVILLISQDFIASDFIYDHELPRAMAKKIKSSGTVIPVYLSECTIFDLKLDITGEPEKLKMGDFYFVPQDDKNNLLAIEEWEHKAKAWNKVYLEVKKKLAQ